MRIIVKYPGAILVCLALAACGTPAPRSSAPAGEPRPAAPTPGEVAPPPGEAAPPQREAAPPGQAGPAGGAGPPGGAALPWAVRYTIDPRRSELRVLVYRAGPMAALGHNHVISTHSLQGFARYDGNASAAAFALTIPVADFVIDDPGLRREEGADFAEDVADEARSGTAHNMLGPAVLNAADFPALTIKSLAVTAAAASGSLEARVALEVAGHASTLVVPFTLERSPGSLTARGTLTVSQSAIGMTPFSVFLGALKVEDELRIKFEFTAVADGA